MADTANFAWTKPTVGGSSGSWGTLLNTLADEIDADLAAVDTVADAAMPKAGGTFTGNVKVKTDTYTAVAAGNIAGAVTFDCAAGRVYTATLTGTATFAFANAPTTGDFGAMILILTNPGAYTITWPSSVKWPGGSAPSFTASGVDVVQLFTIDAGTTWRAARTMADSR